MSPRKSGWWLAAVGIVAVLVLRTTAAGQAADANKGTLDALLIEVRGLRTAMEQMASAGPRVQLAIGRLQLQEQRVNTMVRRADELRAALARIQNEAALFQERLSERQQVLERNTVPPEERLAIEAEIPHLKQEVMRKTGEVQRLQAEEADASSQVTAEQARWVEINQRLEELERALTRR